MTTIILPVWMRANSRWKQWRRVVRYPDAGEVHASLAARHIWCRRFDWADDLLRFGLPPEDRDLERLAAALASAKA